MLRRPKKGAGTARPRVPAKRAKDSGSSRPRPDARISPESGGLLKRILALVEADRPFAVATVLQADSSTPVKAGAKALMEPDGTIHGTVGGGAVEAKAQQLGKLVARSEEPLLFEFNLHGPGVHEAAPICGGSMRVLVAPASSASQADYRRAAKALTRRERGLWLTTLRLQGNLRVKSQFILEKNLPARVGLVPVADLRSCLEQERPALLTPPSAQRSANEAIEVFVEPLIPPPQLVIVGGGHVGQAVAAQAALLGFEIAVLEDRPEFADAALFPAGTRTGCGPVAEQLANWPIGPDTFIVIVTRGHQQDALALRACIRRPVGYLGMIGSRRKVPLLRRQFLQAGWATAEEFDRVYAPIGLDIGAVTVPEIAASIVAQLIAVRRTGQAPRFNASTL